VKAVPLIIIASVLRSVAAARAAVLGTLLIGVSTTNLHAATLSDANWTGMAGYPRAEGPVYATAVDGSGNLYVVGDVFATNIANWNGTNWSSLR